VSTASIPWGKGFSRHSNKEFIQYLFIAKGSAAEVQSQGYIAREKFDEIYRNLDTAAKQISRFITYLKDAG
jgi:four helix bundle protein